MLPLILLVFSFVLAVVAAFWSPNPPRVNLGWLALAFFVLAMIFTGHPII